MPFPFLIVAGIAAVAGVAGVGAAVSASKDNSRAKEINSEANDIIDEAKRRLNQERERTNGALKKLGELKFRGLKNEISDFLYYYKQIHGVDFRKITGFEQLPGNEGKDPFASLSKLQNFASSIASGSSAGVAGGAFTAFASYGATSMLATASTGTAIASLSGVAATNATLAWLGGGTLAAGGFGVAGGTALLGGLVAGPALLVMGLISSSRASENLDKARSNRAKARAIAEQLETASKQCSAITRKTKLFIKLLTKASGYLPSLVKGMAWVIREEGYNYWSYSEKSKKIVDAALEMALTVKEILDTPILKADGSIHPKCDEVTQKDINKFGGSIGNSDTVVETVSSTIRCIR